MWQKFVGWMIIVSVLSLVLETVPELVGYKSVFNVVEWLCVGVFTYDYVRNIVEAKSKVKYITSVWGVIDLLAILPSILGFANISYLKSARAIRLIRMLRMLRLIKLSKSVKEHGVDGNDSGLMATIYFATLAISCLFGGVLLYATQGNLKEYESIPLAMIQSAKLLLGGVGYAPMQGVTGELSVLLIRLLGLALLGILISVVGGMLHKLLFGKK